MEACVRGFSFVPENKVEVVDLQYIESGELERTWKVSRRHRIKEQEQKIWEEFVKENDIVDAAFKEDPYQFLHELPENCLKDLMESELVKIKKEIAQDVVEQPKQGEGDSHPQDKAVAGHVTFVEEEKEPCDMFHIFDDENDNDNENDNDKERSGPEDEMLNDSVGSPCTVRERSSVVNSPVPVDKRPSKSSENVTSLVESSIYCARVKDLRLKINEELFDIMASLDIQNVVSIEQEDLNRKCRRATEFSSRFNRIYMYQLQRQMHDIKRNSDNSLPFAKHTQFQAQMLRIVSLHQNMLQAIQVVRKSCEQSWWARESGASLRAAVRAARAASALCAAAPAPRGLAAAAGLYRDELLVTCDKLEDALDEYTERMSNFINSTDTASTSASRKTKKSRTKGGKKIRSTLSSSKSGSRTNLDTDTRLSMYSLDTVRPPQPADPAACRGNHSSVYCKMRAPPSSVENNSQQGKQDKSLKGTKRSPRSRRPLMRAPSGGRPRGHVSKDAEITTMVEAVGCTSSHMSREGSPRGKLAPAPAPAPAPARAHTPRKTQTTSPAQVLRSRALSPKAKFRRSSPKPSQILKALNNINIEALDSESTKEILSPVSKISVKKNQNRNAVHAQKVLKEIGYKDPKEGRRSIESSPRTKDGHSSREETNSARENHNRDVGIGQDMAYSKSSPNSKRDGQIVSPGKEESYIGKEAVQMTADEIEIPRNSPRKSDDRYVAKSERTKASSNTPDRYEVTRLLRQLCHGDASGSGGRSERASGAKNAQLLCINGGSPRQPSTPQLLRILEETIQKKAPKPMYPKPTPVRDPDRYRLTFNISEKVTAQLNNYRTKFVQHMLTSLMYANSSVGKPWEMIGSVSEKIVDDVLLACVKEMQINDVIQELYNCETN